MSKKNAILLSLITASIIISCQSKRLLTNSQYFDYDSIIVYLLNNSEFKESKNNTKYIEGRIIDKKVDLSYKEKQEIFAELFNSENYEPINRKCSFVPVFAIQYKGNLIALLDVEYCPHVKMIDTKGLKTSKQLITDNHLKNILSNKD